MFSMILGGNSESSHILIGGYNMKYAKEGEILNWHNLIKDPYWTVNLSSVKIGDNQIKTYGKTAIIDSGSSYILLPESDF